MNRDLFLRVFFCFCFLSPYAYSQVQTSSDHEIESYIKEIQQSYRLPGLALAIVRDGKLIHRRNYGLANLEFSVPMTDETMFPLFSSTKVISVIAVHQLIEQGKLSLDSNIALFLDDLPQSWHQVKIEHLLTHSSGLPDIVAYENLNEAAAKQAVYSDPIKFEQGDQFDYNQTNYWLLNRIFQKILGKSLSAYIMETQFSGQQSSAMFEGDNLKVIKNLSSGYNNTGINFYKRNWNFPEYIYGAAGLNLSMNAFLAWNKKLDDGKFISPDSMIKVLKPFVYSKPRSFCYGWDMIELNGVATYGFTGGMSTAYRKVPQKKLTLILLANAMFIPLDQRPGLDAVVNKLILMADRIK